MKKALIILVALFCLVGMTNAQSKFGITVQGAVSMPMGDFGDLAKTGFGGLGTVTYTLQENIDLVGTIGYLTYDHKDMSYFGSSVTGSTSLVPVIAGARYFFAASGFKPYVTAQVGMYFSSAKVESSFGGYANSGTVSDSYFGFSGGAGLLYKLGTKMDLDVNATFNTVSDISFFTIAAGLHFAL